MKECGLGRDQTKPVSIPFESVAWSSDGLHNKCQAVRREKRVYRCLDKRRPREEKTVKSG